MCCSALQCLRGVTFMLHFPCLVRAFHSVLILCHWLIQLPFLPSFCFQSLAADLTTPPVGLSPFLPSSLHAALTSLLLCLCSSFCIPVLRLLCLSKCIKICVQSGSQGLGVLVKLHLQEDLSLLVATCPCQHVTFISDLWVSAFPCKLYPRNV